MEDLSKIIKRRLTPGVLIFDVNNKLLYFNKEALEMIPEMQKAVKTERIKIPEKIYNLCKHMKSTASTASTVWEVEHSGLHCSLRAFFIGGHREDKKPIHIMVLIERIIEKHDIDFEKARTNFKFTNREMEVLKLLCQGLTNREVSEKLSISEYTVKDYIKKIMGKTGVDSRSKIIASLL
jgi:DNA-binding CsgD family transcriptional regulator